MLKSEVMARVSLVDVPTCFASDWNLPQDDGAVAWALRPRPQHAAQKYTDHFADAGVCVGAAGSRWRSRAATKAMKLAFNSTRHELAQSQTGSAAVISDDLGGVKLELHGGRNHRFTDLQWRHGGPQIYKGKSYG
jgi:hypothetical protein